METKATEELAFFDFPIEHFANRNTQWLLEDKENVRELLESIADHLGVQFDFNQLTHIDESFVPDNLRNQESDVLYRVPFCRESKTNEVFIYVLTEHQSNTEATIEFQLLFYMTQIWEFQRRDWESNNTPKSQWRLRPIIPIVFYTQEQRWQIPMNCSTLMDLPDIFSGFVEWVAIRSAKTGQ